MEIAENYSCPKCGQPYLKVYYSDRSGPKVGAWCEYCNMKAYYFGENSCLSRR
jgi:DNA-directed RNA polymerase subunit RPC12/RpoP